MIKVNVSDLGVIVNVNLRRVCMSKMKSLSLMVKTLLRILKLTTEKQTDRQTGRQTGQKQYALIRGYQKSF